MRITPKRLRAVRRLLVALAVAVVALGVVTAAQAAVPQNTSPPTISGTPREGQTLTAADGSWSNSPTSFTYQWRRCASDGTGCGDITGATGKTYKLVAGDVGHTVRVAVTAHNASGSSSATSAPTDVIASKNGPTNTVKPALSGSAVVGDTLTVSNGTWTPTPSSYSRQWQQCASDGTGCVNVAGATGKTYGVRSADVGHRLRALVTAHTSNGQATAVSNTSAVVTQTVVTTTVTTPAPKPPTIRILALRRVRERIRARVHVCNSTPGTVRITEQDHKAGARPATRHLSMYVSGCRTFRWNWLLLRRYRKPGRLIVTMRAQSHGLLSRRAERSIRIR